MKRWSVVVLVALTAALTVPALAGAATWSEPIRLGGNEASMQAVKGGDRLTVAMWTEETVQFPAGRWASSLYAADRLAGTPAWRPPVRLTSGGEKSHRAKLAVSADDRAVVLWTPADANGAPAPGIRVVERTGPGTWSQPRDIPGIDGVIHDAQFVSSGALLISWSRSEETERFVTRVQGDRWAEPVHTQLPELAQGPFGRFAATWAAFAVSPNGHLAIVGVDKLLRLVAWRGHENGTWSEPIPLSLGPDNWFLRRVGAVVDSNGAITVITMDKGFGVIGARLNPGSTSWVAHQFNTPGFFFVPTMFLSASGEPTAFWLSPASLASNPSEGSASGSPGFLQTSTLGADGTWGPVHTFRDGERTMPADDPSAVAAIDGRPAIAWAPHDDFQPANLNVSRMQPDGSWATEQIAPGYRHVADAMKLASDRRGNLTAAWMVSGSGAYVASTDPALPRAPAAAPAPGASGQKLRILAHRARATSRWSKLRPKALPVTCRLSVAGTCTFRATLPRPVAKRLGLRLPKRGPYVAGSKRIAVRANATKRSRVVLKPAVRRAITRALAPTNRRALRHVTFTVRNTASAGAAKATRATAYKVTANPPRRAAS